MPLKRFSAFVVATRQRLDGRDSMYVWTLWYCRPPRPRRISRIIRVIREIPTQIEKEYPWCYVVC